MARESVASVSGNLVRRPSIIVPLDDVVDGFFSTLCDVLPTDMLTDAGPDVAGGVLLILVLVEPVIGADFPVCGRSLLLPFSAAALAAAIRASRRAGSCPIPAGRRRVVPSPDEPAMSRALARPCSERRLPLRPRRRGTNNHSWFPYLSQPREDFSAKGRTSPSIHLSKAGSLAGHYRRRRQRDFWVLADTDQTHRCRGAT